MAEAAVPQPQTEETEQFGPTYPLLFITLVGGVLVVNSYVARLLFPSDPIISDISACAASLLLGAFIMVNAYKEVRDGRMHMSVLVAIAVVAAISLGGGGEADMVAGFKEAGIVAFFMLMATLIERQTAAGARKSVEQLMTLTPPVAELVSGQTVRVSELKTGDRVRVRPGDRVPGDGVIVTGQTTIDEKTITGESVPADKMVGDEVFAGTSNVTGSVEVEVTRIGEGTTLGKVKRLILEAESTKTPVMQLIDRYAQWYTPVVLMAAAIVFIFTRDPKRVITFLVVACPCALVLATPTAMVAGLSAAARLGILIKKIAHLEIAGDITAMVFDKTGTLTTGALTVTQLSPTEGIDAAELLTVACSLEQHSRHPVAQAVCRIAERVNVVPQDVDGFRETPGRGVSGRVGAGEVMVGRDTFLAQHGVEVAPALAFRAPADPEAMSLLFVARDGVCIGWIGLEDRARPEAKKATEDLTELGVKRLSMLTGDRWSVAKKVATELGCTDVQGECLPEQKLHLVEILRNEGYVVAVVGDGVNDAPALAAGDLGIAMGAAGSDVAIDSASIALMSDDLGRLPFLIRLSRRLRSVIVQNLLFGIAFVIGGLVLASMEYIGPVGAALAQVIGSFVVIFNSARLVRFGEHLSPHAGPVGDGA